MNTRNMIWYDFVHTRYGGEYLILYLKREREAKKWIKIITVALSAGGIFSAFQEFKIPTIITLVAISVVQMANLLGTVFTHSDEEIQEICRLRLMYFDLEHSLEKLFNNYQSMDEDEAKKQLFNLRESAKKIEELDGKINIHLYKKLEQKANEKIINYINTYYNEQIERTSKTTTPASS